MLRQNGDLSLSTARLSRIARGQSGSVELDLNDVVAKGIFLLLIGHGLARPGRAIPPIYERFMGRWSRLVAPQLVDFTEVSDHGHLLDVGSGTGALASPSRNGSRGSCASTRPKNTSNMPTVEIHFQIGSRSRPAMHNSCALPMRASTLVSPCWCSVSSRVPLRL